MRTRRLLASMAVLAFVPATGAARVDPSVLAVDWRVPGQERLVLADPVTLRPTGAASLALAGHGWPYAFTPDRARLVLGRWQRPSLRIVDVRKLRVLRDVPLGGTGRVEVKAVAWLGGQIVVLLEPRRASLVLVRVDSRSGRILASTPIGSGAADVEATPTRLVALLAPIGRIGTARLVIVTRDRVRTVVLDRIAAGSVAARGRRPHTFVQPGLALSPEAPRAWVLGAARSAEVDLRTLEVRYRGDARRPSSPQKEPVAGSARDAAWVAAGRLVVAGWHAPRERPTKIEPTGLRLLETNDWSDRLVHPDALLFYLDGPRLLTMAPGEPGCAASALTAFTLAGEESYRVCERRATGEIVFAGRYARLGRVDGRVAVVDLSTGRVVARPREVRIRPLSTVLVQEP